MQNSFDIVIIGAGIHGAGVAQAAAVKGYKVLVLEKASVASGTSSKSSKLIHGGLRYLETAQLSLVRECLTERAILLRNAPDLVSLKPFLIPVYRWTSRRPWKIALGLGLYALLAGQWSQGRFTRIDKTDWSDLDGLQTQGLQAVFQYYDAQTDDRQLTRAVLESAQKYSAAVSCLSEVTAVSIQKKHCEIEYRDNGGDIHHVIANCVVNAAGPWVNEVVKKVKPLLPIQDVDLVQGCHIIIDEPQGEKIYYLESRLDRRAIFVMPWYGKTMIGTTEHLYTDSADKVRPLAEEIDYLLQVYNDYFPSVAGGDRRITDSFAGLRVLPRSGQSAFKRPRETCLVNDVGSPHRLVSVYGGKLTAYRATADKVLHNLRQVLPQPRRGGDTRNIKLYRPTKDSDSISA